MVSVRFVFFIIGTILAGSVAGNINNSGMLIPYISSYFYLNDSSIRNSDLGLIVPVSFITESLFTVIIIQLSAYFVLYDLVVLSTVLSISVIFFSSFIQNVILFSFLYGVSLGILSSCLFLPIMMIIWQETKENQFRYTGIFSCAYSFGVTPFGILFTVVVNPNNTSAEKVESYRNEPDQMYPESVASRVPMSIRWMSVAFLLVSLVGLAFIKRRKIEKNPGPQKRILSLSEVLKTCAFYNILLIFINNLSVLAYIQYVYKMIGNIYIGDDHYLTFIGSASFFAGGLGRLVNGVMLDKYHWKQVMLFNYLIYALLSISFWCTFDSKALYGLYITLLGWFSSSFYIGVARQARETFPGDDWVLSYLGLAFCPACAIPYIIEMWLRPEIGYPLTTFLISFSIVSSALQSIYHPEPAIKASHLEKLINT